MLLNLFFSHVDHRDQRCRVESDIPKREDYSRGRAINMLCVCVELVQRIQRKSGWAAPPLIDGKLFFSELVKYRGDEPILDDDATSLTTQRSGRTSTDMSRTERSKE